MNGTERVGIHGRLAIGIGVLMFAASASAVPVRITVEDVAPANGLRVTPVWFGVHDGSFDTFNSGSPASAQLERLAEDGDPSFVSGVFTGIADGVAFGPISAPGHSQTLAGLRLPRSALCVRNAVAGGLQGPFKVCVKISWHMGGSLKA